MALKLVLFDLDGTLLDTLDDLADATNAALAGFGLPALPASDYKQLVGNGVRILMQRAYTAAARNAASDATATVTGMPADAEMIAAFNREYDARWDCKTHPYDGIPELLVQLRAAGLSLCILSNKPDAFTCKIAERFFQSDAFDLVTGMRADRPGKPDPTLALELCRQAGVSPFDSVLVGDSSTDILTAKAAGMAPVGVLWGFRSADELSGAGARHLVRTPVELAELLLAMQRQA